MSGMAAEEAPRSSSPQGGSASHSTPAQKLQIAFDLHRTGMALQRQNLKRQHPDADEEQIDALLDAWLGDRPGAPFGDAVGSDGSHRFR